MKKIALGWIIILIIMLVGCSEEPKGQDKATDSSEKGMVITPDDEQEQSEPKQPEENTKEKQTENFDLDPLPTTVEELATLPQGKYAREIFNNKDGAEKENAALLDYLGEDMPEISSDPSDKELDYFFREVLKLVQDDYVGADDILKDLKFQLLGNPEIEDPRYQFKEQLNISILLDASGSMAGQINGKTKMNMAKEAITDFIEQLPEETNVSLRVYGHKGTGADSDKELSCSSSEKIYGFSPYEEETFSDALNTVKPAGWTPNGLALSKAQEDLADFNGEENTNIVYLVSDGIETCETEPVKVAKGFYDSNIQPIINVIGFDVDSEGQNHLKEIAGAAEGLYQTANDKSELVEEFDKINELAEAWETWKEKGMQNIDLKETQNSIDIFSFATRNKVKLSEEKTSLKYIFQALQSTDAISQDDYQKLQERNAEYHKKMRSAVVALKEELYEWNEKSHIEAMQKLEDKYLKNKKK